jgi:hypothetical protein
MPVGGFHDAALGFLAGLRIPLAEFPQLTTLLHLR